MRQPTTLTDRARRWARHLLDPLAVTLHRLGVHPDAVTLLGLLLTGLGAVFIARGDFQVAAAVLLVALPLDAVDGALARRWQHAGTDLGDFGGVLDSTADRYADGFIFMAFGYYFADHGRMAWLLLALVALIGAYLVSYVRARAPVAVTVGWLTRLERLLLVLVILLLPALLEIGIVVLALGTHITALQRLWHVRHSMTQRGD